MSHSLSKSELCLFTDGQNNSVMACKAFLYISNVSIESFMENCDLLILKWKIHSQKILDTQYRMTYLFNLFWPDIDLWKWGEAWVENGEI